MEAELNDGKLPPEVHARHKQLAIELGFSAMDVPAAHGGRDARVVDQVAVWEQLGRVTNALCWCFSEPQRWMFEACTPEQLARYVLPLMTGKRKECYAITESGSGSDVDDRDHARRAAGGLPRSAARSGTSPARTTRTSSSCRPGWRTARTPAQHCLFFIDKDQPGIELVRTPRLQPHVQRSPSDLSLQRRRSSRSGSGSARKATACSTRTAGSAASG